MLDLGAKSREFSEQSTQRKPSAPTDDGPTLAGFGDRDDTRSRKFLTKSIGTSCERAADLHHQFRCQRKMIEALEELLLRELRRHSKARGFAHATTPGTDSWTLAPATMASSPMT